MFTIFFLGIAAVVIQQEFWLFNYSISGYWLGTDRETCVWTGIQ